MLSNVVADWDATPFRILSLDGGGAKGFYTLGILKEIEALVGCPLHETFPLIFGSSTGAIIAALLALGRKVGETHALYREHVPTIMRPTSRDKKLDITKSPDVIDGYTQIRPVVTRWFGFAIISPPSEHGHTESVC